MNFRTLARWALAAAILWTVESSPGATIRLLDGNTAQGDIALTRDGKVKLTPATGPAQQFDLENIEEVVFKSHAPSPSRPVASSNAWAHCDLGEVDQPGRVEFGPHRQITLQDTGRGLGSKDKGRTRDGVEAGVDSPAKPREADRCLFVHQRIQGNVEITARVRCLESGRAERQHLRAGLMIRRGLEPDAAFVAAGRTDGETGLLLSRLERGEGLLEAPSAEPAILGAAWIKLVRQEHAVRAYESPDGKTWTKLVDATLLLPEGQPLWVGLVSASAGGVDRPGRAIFDHVAISVPEPAHGSPWLPGGVLTRDGSVLAGDVASANDTSVVLQRANSAPRTFIHSDLAALCFASLSPAQQATVRKGQRGAVLLDGSLAAGDFLGLEADEVVISSVLFGRQRFARKTRASAVVVGAVTPGACAFEVELADRSRLRARSLDVAEDKIVVSAGVLGKIEVPLADLVRFRRQIEPARASQPGSALRDKVARALKKAASYYRERVASHGGYVYYYSPDLEQRWGEGKASIDTIFVQPPGTPTVGMAYLEAYAATGDKFYLEAARETAEALVYGQLASGGWTQVIHFAPPEQGRLGKYRKGKGGSWNVSSLDDGQSQAALQFLSRADHALNFQHAEIHDATSFGLKALLKAQFPNGAFPQGWRGPVEPQPVQKARLPEYDWKTEGRVKNYWGYYTLNDNVAGTVADTLIVAHQVYGDEKYRVALRKLGDFLVLAQMPEPQPGWCQQYNYDMVPIWARKFEPPAITGWESQDVMETLIRIARYTGDLKYLEPIPIALEYFTKKCLLPDGKIARYYELRTNKPLYMDKGYQLTYDDSAAPSHYGWKQAARFEQIEQAYQAAKTAPDTTRTRSARELEEDARRILAELDHEGRWITTFGGETLVGQPNFERGFRYISSGVFSHNVETLSEDLASLSSHP